MNTMTEVQRDIDIDSMIRNYGIEFLRDNYPELEPREMETLNDELDALRALECAFHGYDYKDNDKPFNPYSNYYVGTVYGELVSIEYVDDYLFDTIDEDEFVEWLSEYKEAEE